MKNKLKIKQYSEQLDRQLNLNYRDRDYSYSKLLLTYLFYSIKKNNKFDEFKNSDDIDITKYFRDRNLAAFYDMVTKNIPQDVLLFSSIIRSTELTVFEDYLTESIENSFWYERYEEGRYNVEDLIEKFLDIKSGQKLLYYYNYTYSLLKKLLSISDLELTIFVSDDKNWDEERYYQRYAFIKIYVELNTYNANVVSSMSEIRKERYERIYIESGNAKQDSIPLEDEIVRNNLAENAIAVKYVKDSNLDSINENNIYSRGLDLDKRIIKSVITLPANASYIAGRYGTNRAIEIYDNSVQHDSITFVNATLECITEKRDSWFSKENIENIVKAVNGNKFDFNTKIPYEDIKKNSNSFDPFIYISNGSKLNHSIELGKVAEVFRGNDLVRVRKRMEADIVRTGEYEYRSLAAADLEYENINYEKLPFVRIDKNIDEFVLREGDIVLNKNGSKIRCVLFEGQVDLNIVPDGNILIIRPNKDKVNSLFLKKYFDSVDGTNALLNIAQSGSVLKSINVSRIVKVSIPNPSIEEQNEFALEYKTKKENIIKLNAEIETICKKYFFN